MVIARPVRYVKLELFAEFTGYSVKALNQKIDKGVWMEGREFKRAPDGHRLIDIERFEKWVEMGQA